MSSSSQRRLAVIAAHVGPESSATHAKVVCGIIAVVGGTNPAVDYVMEGLTVLQVTGCACVC